MTPWLKLDSATVPDGQTILLFQRGDELSIQIGDLILMNSRSHHSEEQLAVLGCAHCTGRPGQRVLVGGLGMGFTLRAALDTLAADATVTVVELVPEVVAWNRGVLAHLASAPLEDPRTRVVIDDVTTIINGAANAYDAILLDVDNGPVGFTADRNNRLYNKAGLARIFRALTHRGVLALWSSGDDGPFTARLRQTGFCTTKKRVRAREGSGRAHTVWLAIKTSERAATLASGARREGA